MRRIDRALIAAALAAGAGAAVAQEAGDLFGARWHAGVGRYLTDGEGRALYTFGADRPGAIACAGDCAVLFPPYLVEGPLAVGEIADAPVSTVERPGGSTQVAYGGAPLYRFAADEGRGQATGHGVKEYGGEWTLATTAAAPDAPSPFAGLDLAAPECVRFDPERDRYLVSNINGEMLAADDNGFISAVKPDGIAELKWIAGGEKGVTLNAPKGMALHEGRLIVADIDHLRLFDAASGDYLGAVRIPGAQFLNDMTVAEDGTLYVTDTGAETAAGAVYRVSSGDEIEAIAEGRHLHRPNGIDFDPQGRLIVVTYGADEVLTMTTEGEILERRTLDAGQLDGLVVRPDGTTLVSSWNGRSVARLAPDGTVETLATGLTQPACFDVDPTRQLLLVPQVKSNEVAVIPLGAIPLDGE